MSVLGKAGDFDSPQDRSSLDNETRGVVSDLIKDGKITLETALRFFNHGCAVYKRAQSIYQISDSKINIEFQYAARAFASYLNDFDEELKTLALLDAFQASRHIVNDALDLILSHIRKELSKSDAISNGLKIEDVIDNFHELDAVFVRSEKIVEESRRTRGLFRYESYLDIIHSGDYDKLCQFLIEISKGVRKLYIARSKEIKEDRRFILTTCIAILAIVLTVVVGIGVVVYDEQLKGFRTKLTPSNSSPKAP